MNAGPYPQLPRSRAARLRRHTVALARVARAVLQSSEGLGTAFAVLAPIAMEVLALQRVALWELDAAGQLSCVHALGSDSLPAQVGAHGPAPRWPTRRMRADPVAEEVRVVRVHDNATLLDPDWRDSLRREGVAAHIDVQLRVDDTVWGRLRFESTQPRHWPAEEGALAGYFADVLAVAIERERRRAAEARLHYLELYDPASGVANRTMFHACIGQLLARMQRRPRLAALLFINVDRFFNVNETLGEVGGDSMLAVLAERINMATPDDAVLARVESDCFAVLLPRIAGEWQAAAQAEALLEAIAQPLSPTLEVSASIGIAFAGPANVLGAEELLRDADLASKQAKAGGRNRVEVFDPECHRNLVERLRIERALRAALRDDRIEIAYQAEFELDTGEIVGAEALARWRLEDGRLLAAGEFIDVAETSGLIEPIGYRVLAGACVEARGWPLRADGSARMVRVNISARQFAHSGLFDAVEHALGVSGLAAASLCLEITETTLMSQAGFAQSTLDRLKALGVSLAIDDFGTGYSSLAYLHRFPVQTLKLDKAMIDGLPDDASARAIVIAVREMAAALKLEVVVEGIEYQAQADCLYALGFRHMQGFHYARPESARAFADRLRAGRDVTASPVSVDGLAHAAR